MIPKSGHRFSEKIMLHEQTCTAVNRREWRMNAPASRRSESFGYHRARQSDRSRRLSGGPMIRN
jgi:hypothetical protein